MTPVVTLQRLMSISHAEFLHTLEQFGRHHPCQIDTGGRRILIAEANGEVMIELGDQEVRRLGALSLPQTRVGFRFTNLSPPEIERFLSRFDLCFRRGGG